jgi:nucleoid-associated protein YgaU
VEIVRPRWYTFDQAFDRTRVRQLHRRVATESSTNQQEQPMSAATEFAPAVYIPPQARAHRPAQQLASVTALYPPSEQTIAPPVRLTRRGVVVVAGAVAVLAAALLLLAWLSAPSGAAAGTAAPRTVPATVTVQPGDTLWGIASRLAPQRDPRAEVAELQQLNSLPGGALVPGQVLRTR